MCNLKLHPETGDGEIKRIEFHTSLDLGNLCYYLASVKWMVAGKKSESGRGRIRQYKWPGG